MTEPDNFPAWADKWMSAYAREFGKVKKVDHPYVEVYYTSENWLFGYDFAFLGDDKEEAEKVVVPEYEIRHIELDFVIWNRKDGEVVAFTGVKKTDTMYWYHSRMVGF